MIVKIGETYYNLAHYIMWQKAPQCVELIKPSGVIDRIECGVHSKLNVDEVWEKICVVCELQSNPQFVVPKMHPTKTDVYTRPCAAVTPQSPAQIKKKTIAHMKSIRKQGNTYKYIANKLNREGVRTFSGKGIWHAQTVHRTLKG